jgi:thiol:disulfide interchange protein DsbA
MPLLARALIALTALLPLACSAADSEKYQAGDHYKTARVPQAPADPTKIEVMEVFAYSCPHCFQLEGRVEQWLGKKPADVVFVRQPHTLGAPANALRNKAMYTAQMLGGFDKFHKALFGAIHGQGKLMATVEEMREVFVKSTGIKAEDFDGAYSSFMIDSRFRMGEKTVQDLGIASVPAIVVDGKWVVPNGPQVFSIVDFLVEKARKERKK